MAKNNRMIVHKGHVLLLPAFPEDELSELVEKGLHPKNEAKHITTLASDGRNKDKVLALIRGDITHEAHIQDTPFSQIKYTVIKDIPREPAPKKRKFLEE